jgi:hypothetical protein
MPRLVAATSAPSATGWMRDGPEPCRAQAPGAACWAAWLLVGSAQDPSWALLALTVAATAPLLLRLSCGGCCAMYCAAATELQSAE